VNGRSVEREEREGAVLAGVAGSGVVNSGVRSRITNVVGWLLGIALIAGLVYVATHIAEVEQLLALVRKVRLSWLLVALGLQIGTYLCTALVLQRALVRHRVHQRLSALMSLGLAKLFTDQVVPSVGLGGTLLTARGLERRGVPAGAALGALVTSLGSYYVAYSLVATASLLLLWHMSALSKPVLALVTVFCFAIAILPVGLFWMSDRGLRHVPAWIGRFPPVRDGLRALSEVPSNLLRAPRLIGETTSLQVVTFVLDASTLGVMLVALGQNVQADVVFATFVVASVVATIAWVPGGLGTFDATCVAVLHSHGVSLEAALAATLLLRVFTLWIPMAPGLWLARREMASAPGGQARDG